MTMQKRSVYLLAIILAVTAVVVSVGRRTPAPTEDTLDTSEFGPVELKGPVGVARGFVILFSADEGLTDSERKAVDTLVGLGLVTATIDTRKALEGLAQSADEETCIELAGPLEWTSQNAQHAFQFSRYAAPYLLGMETGGTLVYAALAQAPPLAFSGGLSVNFTPGISIRRPFCDLRTKIEDRQQVFTPDYPLRQSWNVGSTGRIPKEIAAFAATSATRNGRKDLGLVSPAASIDSLYTNAVDRLLQESTTTNSAISIGDLPVVEGALRPANGALAIIYSGDGGWRDIDKTLGDLLEERGFAVVGVDALRYFWSKRTPEETATDLERIIKHYRAAWKPTHVLLIGYSFGADILPFAYNRLSEPSKKSVNMISLLAPGREADFEIQIFGWLGGAASANALPTIPEIRRIETGKLQCIYSAEDIEESLCTSEAMQQAENIRRSGGHHFGENYGPIADLIVTGNARRARGG
jgi:type IV secretory pathway VirJ component